ncbi:hypothetical protein CSC81_17435, partial [Tenacibaculum discolor]
NNKKKQKKNENKKTKMINNLTNVNKITIQHTQEKTTNKNTTRSYKNNQMKTKKKKITLQK